MKPQEIKEIIKSEIRVYMRMLRDMKRAMRERLSVKELRKIAAYYNVPEMVVDRLTKREIIIGVNIGGEYGKNEIYKGVKNQEHKEFNFSFCCQLSYKLADALRMYAIYDKHIDLYKQQMQAEVLAEIAKEDELIRPHMDFCNQINCEGMQLCTGDRCSTGEGGHRANKVLNAISEKQSEFTWWKKLCRWFRELRESLTSKKS